MKIKIGNLVRIPKFLSYASHSLWSNSQKNLHETNHAIGAWYPNDIALVIEANEYSIKIFTSKSSGWIKKEYCEIIS